MISLPHFSNFVLYIIKGKPHTRREGKHGHWAGCCNEKGAYSVKHGRKYRRAKKSPPVTAPQSIVLKIDDEVKVVNNDRPSTIVGALSQHFKKYHPHVSLKAEKDPEYA